MAVDAAHNTPAEELVLQITPWERSALQLLADGAATVALALGQGAVPPTINYSVPDPECDLDVVPNTARDVVLDAAITNSCAQPRREQQLRSPPGGCQVAIVPPRCG